MSKSKNGPKPDEYAKGWEAGVAWAMRFVADKAMTRAEIFAAMSIALEDGRKRRAEAVAANRQKKTGDE
mgnify:FL=1